MNILLVTADQWRGDCTGYAGHPLVKTPNLDALAAEGTAFLNHFSQAAPCSPARASLYTGLYQMNHRVCRNGSPLADRFDNIARAARRAGYEPTLFGYTDQSPDPTALAPNDPALTSYEGVLPGFVTRVKLAEDEKPWLSWLRGQGLELHDHDRAHQPVGAEPGAVTAAPPAYAADQTQTAFLAGEFVRWLGEQDAGRPWFAHLSFLRPHPPFIVPPPYNTMFDPRDVGNFARATTADAEGKQHPLLDFALRTTTRDHFIPGGAGRVAELTDAEFRQIRATYFGMIAEVDAQLGRVVAGLKAAGQWDETLVIFTSDHAEMMGDHYLLGKGGYFDESQSIPLVIRVPGQPTGERVGAFTEAVDLFPTLLDALAVAPLHQPDGLSLLPLIAGEASPGWRDAVHWEFDFREVALQTAERWFRLPSTRLSMAVVRTRKWKYVHFAAQPPLLFDLENDPHNLRDLSNDPGFAKVRIEMAERLLGWRAEHLDQTLALRELTASGVVDGRAALE